MHWLWLLLAQVPRGVVAGREFPRGEPQHNTIHQIPRRRKHERSQGRAHEVDGKASEHGGFPGSTHVGMVRFSICFLGVQRGDCFFSSFAAPCSVLLHRIEWSTCLGDIWLLIACGGD